MLDEIDILQQQLQEELQLITNIQTELNVSLPELDSNLNALNALNALMQGGRRKQITKRKKVKRIHSR